MDLLLFSPFHPSFSTTLRISRTSRTMSLPPASKQTTEKPAAGAVMEPVNKDDQAADADRKVCPYPTTMSVACVLTLPTFPDTTLRRCSSLPQREITRQRSDRPHAEICSQPFPCRPGPAQSRRSQAYSRCQGHHRDRSYHCAGEEWRRALPELHLAYPRR